MNWSDNPDMHYRYAVGPRSNKVIRKTDTHADLRAPDIIAICLNLLVETFFFTGLMTTLTGQDDGSHFPRTVAYQTATPGSSSAARAI